RLRPGNGRHWSCLGSLLQRRGDPAGAEAALRKAGAGLREAIRLKPHDAKAHSNLRHAPLPPGKADEAIAAYPEAIRLHPHAAARESGTSPATASPAPSSATPRAPKGR